MSRILRGFAIAAGAGFAVMVGSALASSSLEKVEAEKAETDARHKVALDKVSARVSALERGLLEQSISVASLREQLRAPFQAQLDSAMERLV